MIVHVLLFLVGVVVGMVFCSWVYSYGQNDVCDDYLDRLKNINTKIL